MVLLIIYSKPKKCYYYFAAKSMLELCSSEWLKNKKAVINNNNSSFQNALNDALNCYNIKTDPERVTTIKSFIKQYNWKGIEFLSHQEHRKKLEQNINQFLLIYYMYRTILSRKGLHTYQNIPASVKIK